MQTFIKIVVGLVVFGLALTGAAYLLPGSYHVERTVQIQAPAEVVFAQTNDLRNWQTWTVWGAKDPALKYETSAVSAGAGAWQKWDSPKSGRGELKITASEAPGRVAYDLYFPNEDASSTGEILIAPLATSAGVTVTWTNGGELGMNPVTRWFGLLFDRLIGGDFAAGLERLKTTCEAVAGPAAVQGMDTPTVPESTPVPTDPVAPVAPAAPEAAPAAPAVPAAE